MHLVSLSVIGLIKRAVTFHSLPFLVCISLVVKISFAPLPYEQITPGNLPGQHLIWARIHELFAHNAICNDSFTQPDPCNTVVIGANGYLILLSPESFYKHFFAISNS